MDRKEKGGKPAQIPGTCHRLSAVIGVILAGCPRVVGWSPWGQSKQCSSVQYCWNQKQIHSELMFEECIVVGGNESTRVLGCEL